MPAREWHPARSSTTYAGYDFMSESPAEESRRAMYRRTSPKKILQEGRRFVGTHETDGGTDEYCECIRPVDDSICNQKHHSKLPELYTVHYGSEPPPPKIAQRPRRRKKLQASKSMPAKLRIEKGKDIKGQNRTNRRGSVQTGRRSPTRSSPTSMMMRRRTQREDRAKQEEEKKRAGLRSKAQKVVKDNVGVHLDVPSGALQPIRTNEGRGQQQSHQISIQQIETSDLPPLPEGLTDIGPAIETLMLPLHKAILSPLQLTLPHSAADNSDQDGQVYDREGPFRMRVLRKTRTGYTDVLSESCPPIITASSISFPITKFGIFRVVQAEQRPQLLTMRAYMSSLEKPKAGTEVQVRLCAHQKTPDQRLLAEVEERKRRAAHSYWAGVEEVGSVDIPVVLGHDIMAFVATTPGRGEAVPEFSGLAPDNDAGTKGTSHRMPWKGVPVHADIVVKLPFSKESTNNHEEYHKKLIMYTSTKSGPAEPETRRYSSEPKGGHELILTIKLNHPEAKKKLRSTMFAVAFNGFRDADHKPRRETSALFSTVNRLETDGESVQRLPSLQKASLKEAQKVSLKEALDAKPRKAARSKLRSPQKKHGRKVNLKGGKTGVGGIDREAAVSPETT